METPLANSGQDRGIRCHDGHSYKKKGGTCVHFPAYSPFFWNCASCILVWPRATAPVPPTLSGDVAAAPSFTCRREVAHQSRHQGPRRVLEYGEQLLPIHHPPWPGSSPVSLCKRPSSTLPAPGCVQRRAPFSESSRHQRRGHMPRHPRSRERAVDEDITPKMLSS